VSIKEKSYIPNQLFNGLITQQEMEKVNKSVEQFPKIIKEFYKGLLGKERNCNCNRLMERYKDRVGEDWHNWIGG
ncbi:MAG: phosphorylase, partial [bacterium]|nr:phosphorylase [bacterium]